MRVSLFTLMTLFAVCPTVITAAPVTISQLRALAAEAMRSGDVVYSPPTSKVVHGILWVKDAGPPPDRPAALEYWFDEGDLLKAVFLDQLAIEIRRQRLFAGTRQQLIIEPYYRQMDEIVAGELLLVELRGDDKQKERQLDERLRQLGDVLQRGIEACASDMRLTGSFVEPGQDDGTAWIDRVIRIYLPRTGQFSYRQLNDAVNQALRDQVVAFDLPKAVVEQETLRVVDVGPATEPARSLEPIEEVVAESVKLALRRAQLFKRPENRTRMEPVYAQMEAVIRRRFDALRASGAASASARRTGVTSTPVAQTDSAAPDNAPPRSRFVREIEDLLFAGLRDCARSMGDLRLVYLRRSEAESDETEGAIKLTAPAGTVIDVVHNADHKLWSLAGKSQTDYSWRTYNAGDTADLVGGYWFRLSYPGGGRATLYKKVDATDTEVRFPEP